MLLSKVLLCNPLQTLIKVWLHSVWNTHFFINFYPPIPPKLSFFFLLNISCWQFHEREADFKHHHLYPLAFSPVVLRLCSVFWSSSGTAMVIMIHQQTAIKMWVLLSDFTSLISIVFTVTLLLYSHCSLACTISFTMQQFHKNLV